MAEGRSVLTFRTDKRLRDKPGNALDFVMRPYVDRFETEIARRTQLWNQFLDGEAKAVVKGRLHSILWVFCRAPVQLEFRRSLPEMDYFAKLGLAPDEPSQAAIAQSMLEKGLAPLIARYPHWDKLAQLIVSRAVDSLTELLCRLKQDWMILSSSETPPRGGVGLIPWLSDFHHGHRAVAAVLLGDSATPAWFYKPRSVETEQFWERLVRWLREKDSETFDLRATSVFNQGAYGWAKGVVSRPVLPKELHEVYFRRCGVLLAVARAVSATDFFADNIICDPEGYPVAIDPECLFAPATQDGPAAGLEQTGLLPGRNCTIGPGGAGMAAGLRNESGDFICERFRVYSETVATAYHRARRRLGELADDLLSRDEVLPRPSGLRVRRVLRPTVIYYRCLESALQAEYLTSETTFQARLAMEIGRHAKLGTDPTIHPGEAAAQELDALEQLDLPCWSVGLFEPSASQSQTERASSSWSALRDNLYPSDDAALAAETNFVKYALTTSSTAERFTGRLPFAA